MEPDIIPIAPNETFRFACSCQVACYNECCRDLNQFLTPYDILRLKKNLHMTSDRFLEAYTTQHIGPETGLPVITLKPMATASLQCPFVTETGCSVYPDRPSSCRIYPIARAITRDRVSGKIRQHFARLKESHCLGHAEEKTQTVHQWMEAQGLIPYNHFNDQLIEIISMKKQTPGPLDLASSKIFHLALYDLDTFREKFFANGFRSDFPVEKALYRRAKDNDTALLQIGYAWARAHLFGPTR